MVQNVSSRGREREGKPSIFLDWTSTEVNDSMVKMLID